MRNTPKHDAANGGAALLGLNLWGPRAAPVAQVFPGAIALVLALVRLAGAQTGERDIAKTRLDYARFASTHPGHPDRGRALFFNARRSACATCHRALNQGGAIGPDLSDVGGKLDRALLIEAVLEPSRQIVEGFRTTRFALVDGRILDGIVREETGRTVVIVDPLGKRSEIPIADIDARRPSQTSLMPDGLSAGYTPEEFADLIAFLASLRPQGQGSPGSGVAGPAGVPPGFIVERIATGFSGATALDVSPDGRVFLCEQTGAVRIVQDGKLLPEPFLKIAVDSLWERGLIGITLDPNFSSTQLVYLCYVARAPYPHHVVARVRAKGDTADPASLKLLLEGDDERKLGGVVPAGHQGGAIHFGKDGKLYIAIGDQTAGAPAQALDTFQGKLLRINPDGTLPSDGPFYKQAKGKYRAIWALGLRNPFTFAVQPETGRMLINDVGEARWEEINEGIPGANYGWPAVEGPSTEPRFRPPIHAYPAASIAGGAFCPRDESSRFPAEYRGLYFFADFVKGWIKTLDPVRPERVSTFATGLARPVDLRFSPGGGLHVLVRNAWVKDANFHPETGSLVRIGFTELVSSGAR